MLAQITLSPPEFEIVDWSLQSLRFLQHGSPSDYCRWHAHSEYELHLIVEGMGTAFVGDYVGQFAPGSLYLVGPNLPHNWVTDKANHPKIELRDMLVQFPGVNIGKLVDAFANFRELRPLLDEAAAGLEFFDVPLEKSRAAMARIGQARGAAQAVAFLEFMTDLARHEDRKCLSLIRLQQAGNTPRHEQIGAAVDYITQNYQQDLSVASVAKVAGLSEASFTRYFKQITGNRFTEFVNLVRVRRACSLLLETKEPISAVCYDSGFQNLANFNRQFLRLKGCTPSQFRSHSIAGLAGEVRVA